MKLMEVDFTLKTLETLRQGNNMATLNMDGGKAKDQSRGSVEEGV